MKWEKKMQFKVLENRSPSLQNIKDLQCKKSFWELSPLLYKKRWHHKEREYTWKPETHCLSCRRDGRDIAHHFHLIQLLGGLRVTPLLRHYWSITPKWTVLLSKGGIFTKENRNICIIFRWRENRYFSISCLFFFLLKNSNSFQIILRMFGSFSDCINWVPFPNKKNIEA